MLSASAHRDGRIAGRLYVLYFVLAVAGVALGSVALSVAGTAAYFVLCVQLFRLFAPVDRRVAFVVLPLAALGCLIQGVGMIASDRDLQRLALVFFGLFMVALGYLVARSGFMPRAIGVYLLLAGIAWCTAVLVPTLPIPIAVAVMGFGGLSELVFALWLLFGLATPSSRTP